MNPTGRIISNTLAQYLKSVLTIVLSLYATRLVLGALGASDYGIYQLVAGVVAMIGFVTNALVTTTQRYISHSYGENDIRKVGMIFRSSLLIHVVLGAVLLVILLAVKNPVFQHWLSMDPERVKIAGSVYVAATVVLILSIVVAPFKAMFIARENMVFICVVEIADGLLKLLLAMWLSETTCDKLFFYAMMLVVIQVANLLIFAAYAIGKFPECRISFGKDAVSMDCIRQLSGFAGWTTYGMGIIVMRNQGIAVMLNHFFGTIINAAYGIAFQIYGAVSFVSTSILNAMNPQIMKAEGNHDRERMMRLAKKESLFSVLLMLIVSMPIIIEMPNILDVWLDSVPDGTAMFCIFIIASFLVDQLTSGLNSVMQALGEIRTYSILVYTPKLVALVFVWLFLDGGCGPESAMWVYLSVECVVSFMRLPISKIKAGLDVRQYVRDVIVPVILIAAIVTAACEAVVLACDFKYRFLLTILFSILVGAAGIWFLAIGGTDRESVKKMISTAIRKCRA